MSDINVKFSYFRADEDFVYEPTFNNETKLSLTYKGPDKIVVWINPLTGEVVSTSLTAPNRDDRIEELNTIGGVSIKSIREVVINPKNDDMSAMAAWFLKSGHGTADMREDLETDPDQKVVNEYETISYEFNGNTIEWERLKNPNPNDLYQLQFLDTDNDDVWEFDFNYRTIANDTAAEIAAIQRKKKVKWFADEFDLGDEGEAAALEFLTKIDKFIAGVDKVRPWHLKESNILWAPKIPATIAKPIADIVAAGLDDGRPPWDEITRGDIQEVTLSYKELHNG